MVSQEMPWIPVSTFLHLATDQPVGISPQWWQVASGMLAVPAALIGLIYSYALLRKTHIETQLLKLKLHDEREARARSPYRSPPAETVSPIESRDEKVHQSGKPNAVAPISGISTNWLVSILISLVLPGLGSFLMRGKVVLIRSISLFLAIPLAFAVFGPLWGDVVFSRMSLQVRELGWWPFLATCIIVPITSVYFGLRDRETVLSARRA